MSYNRSRDAPPGGYESWRSFYQAKKEMREQKATLTLQRLSEQKDKESSPKVKTVEAIGNQSTLSIAVPGSILENAQSVELRTYLAGQIARAACVFKVDEVVVYDDIGVKDAATDKTVPSVSEDGELCPARRCCAQLARILQYLECPQYLRKDFFPKSRDLEYAGLLNPLDAPHHMRQRDESKFREGIVMKVPAKNGSYVNVGLLENVKVDRVLQPGIRVTVEMLPPPFAMSKRQFGRVVSPSYPHQATGIYWGYTVRLAKSLSAVLTACPHKEGYDLSIGTSERGDPVEAVTLPKHKHALVVFGGLAGIEAALEADDVLTESNPAYLFDYYLNTCPDQGSRTIRTEEAVLITLSELRTRMKPEVASLHVNGDNSDESLQGEGSSKGEDVLNESNVSKQGDVGKHDSDELSEDQNITPDDLPTLDDGIGSSNDDLVSEGRAIEFSPCSKKKKLKKARVDKDPLDATFTVKQKRTSKIKCEKGESLLPVLEKPAEVEAVEFSRLGKQKKLKKVRVDKAPLDETPVKVKRTTKRKCENKGECPSPLSEKPGHDSSESSWKKKKKKKQKKVKELGDM